MLAKTSSTTWQMQRPGKSASVPPDATHETVREEANIQSDMDFLRAMEDGDTASKRKDRRSGSGSKHMKRASLPSISLSSTKSLLAGKFGDAFRRFEQTNSSSSGRNVSPPRFDRRRLRDLSPIAVSEATSDQSRDALLTAADELSPERKRDLERQVLEHEEQRVEAAGVEYRKRLAGRTRGAMADSGGRDRDPDRDKAASIQKKVKALLDEKTVVMPRTRRSLLTPMKWPRVQHQAKPSAVRSPEDDIWQDQGGNLSHQPVCLKLQSM
ncbi:MAG: hypothetical protein M1826_000287 [Phylliscum demangeonii]|nr:MAG: hypothetical protein M1826_000287 [Phylliscum demangeonii]